MIDKGSQYHASNHHTLGWWESIYCSYNVNEIKNRKEYEQVFNICKFFLHEIDYTVISSW